MVILLMMMLVAGTGLLSNPFTIGVQSRLMRDLALLLIEVFSVGFALALGSTAIPNEIEKKTLYPFLAKAVTRGEYLWSKLTAIAFFVFMTNLLLGLELFLIIAVSTQELHPLILAACLLIGLEAVVVSAFSLWFSTFTTPPVTFASVLLLYVTGSISHVYTVTLTLGNPVMNWLLLRTKSLLPYFDYFSIRSAVTHDHPVSLAYLGSATLYGILYVWIAMQLAELTFLRKDL